MAINGVNCDRFIEFSQKKEVEVNDGMHDLELCFSATERPASCRKIHSMVH